MVRSAGDSTDQCFHICADRCRGHSRYGLSIDHLLVGLGWQAVEYCPGQQVVGTARVYQKTETLSRYSPWYEQTTNVHDCLSGHSLSVRRLRK